MSKVYVNDGYMMLLDAIYFNGKKKEFEYKKERDAGISQEIEDLDDIEEEIYGKAKDCQENKEKGCYQSAKVYPD